MISASLPILRGVDSVALSKLKFVGSLLELRELPPDEGVIEGILRGGNESSSPVSGEAKVNEILLSSRREEGYPVVRVLELRDLLFSYAKLHEYFVLRQHWFAISVNLVSGPTVSNLTCETDR